MFELKMLFYDRFGHKLNYVINTFVKHTPGAVPEILKGGAHNSRVPNYRIPALIPF